MKRFADIIEIIKLAIKSELPVQSANQEVLQEDTILNKSVLFVQIAIEILLAEKDFASNSNEITQTFSVKQGLNRIKLVAEKNTELDLVLASTDGDFQELGINW